MRRTQSVLCKKTVKTDKRTNSKGGTQDNKPTEIYGNQGRGEKGKLLTGAATIAMGGLLAKLIGAFYRIPLTNLIGGEGIGLYQLVYPFYCILLTISATGIPSAIATLTARRVALGEPTFPLFKTCMRLFLAIGAVSTAIMVALAPLLAKLQGDVRLTGGYYALAPSVLIVSAISVFRGYFQGENEMFPTAVSEVVEQAVKVGVGLLTAYIFRADVYKAVTALLLSVTISEVVALILLWSRFRREPSLVRLTKPAEKVPVKSILRLSIPVTLSACLLPTFGLIDSVLLVRLLKPYAENAVTLYGLFSGGAVTIVNLPVSVCYGVAAASIPALSSALEKGENGRKKLLYSLLVTALLSAVAVAMLYLFAGRAVGILFRSLALSEKETLTKLVKGFSVSAFTLSCTQTLSACLTAMGKPMKSALAMGVAMSVKTVLNVLLVSRPALGIFGAVISANVGYALSFALDLYSALRETRARKLPTTEGKTS